MDVEFFNLLGSPFTEGCHDRVKYAQEREFVLREVDSICIEVGLVKVGHKQSGSGRAAAESEDVEFVSLLVDFL